MQVGIDMGYRHVDVRVIALLPAIASCLGYGVSFTIGITLHAANRLTAQYIRQGVHVRLHEDTTFKVKRVYFL